MTEKTASQRGRSANAKGKAFQAAVAKAIRPWFPEAISGRDNGYRTSDFTAPDTGDLANAGNLFWSLKNVASAQSMPGGTIEHWMQEATEKGGGNKLPILVIKRKGYANPLRSWCWIWLSDMALLLGGDLNALDEEIYNYPMMMELGFLLDMLSRAGATSLRPGMAAVVA